MRGSASPGLFRTAIFPRFTGPFLRGTRNLSARRNLHTAQPCVVPDICSQPINRRRGSDTCRIRGRRETGRPHEPFRQALSPQSSHPAGAPTYSRCDQTWCRFSSCRLRSICLDAPSGRRAPWRFWRDWHSAWGICAPPEARILSWLGVLLRGCKFCHNPLLAQSASK